MPAKYWRCAASIHYTGSVTSHCCCDDLWSPLTIFFQEPCMVLACTLEAYLYWRSTGNILPGKRQYTGCMLAAEWQCCSYILDVWIRAHQFLPGVLNLLRRRSPRVLRDNAVIFQVAVAQLHFFQNGAERKTRMRTAKTISATYC